MSEYQELWTVHEQNIFINRILSFVCTNKHFAYLNHLRGLYYFFSIFEWPVIVPSSKTSLHVNLEDYCGFMHKLCKYFFNSSVH